MPFKLKIADQPSELSAMSDVDLFKVMSQGATSPILASSALEEFYRRYNAYLWRCCLHICRSTTEGEDLAKDIFQSTLHKIFIKAGTYDSEKGTGVKAWMSRIAYNEFIDHYNKYNKHFELVNELPEVEDAEYDEEALANQLLMIREGQLKELLRHLNLKEFKILMTCMAYYQIDNPNGHVPDKVIADLCSEFNIKPDAIRQIKRRALIKLKKFLSQQ